MPYYYVIDADMGPEPTSAQGHRILAATAEDAAWEYWHGQDGTPKRSMDVWVRPYPWGAADEFFSFEAGVEVGNV